MKISTLAVVCGIAFCSAASVNVASAAADMVSGGTVNFIGQVVNAACSVSSESADQTVRLDQVRTERLQTAGEAAGQKQPFEIVLKDCDITVSQNAGVTFNGQSDSSVNTALANTAGAGAAKHVALQLYGPDEAALNLGSDSSTITLIDGTNHIPLSVDYLATDAAGEPGDVSATATFNVNYS